MCDKNTNKKFVYCRTYDMQQTVQNPLLNIGVLKNTCILYNFQLDFLVLNITTDYHVSSNIH